MIDWRCTLLVKFLFIRVLIFSGFLALVSFLMGGNHLDIPVGILIGSFISVYKLRLYATFLSVLTQNGKKIFIQSLALNLFSQALVLVVLVLAVIVNVHLFFGVAAGLLSTSIVICLNGLTETIGVTNNNWKSYDKED